jgi:hypothetical protein
MKILKVLAPLFVIALLVTGCQKSTDTPKSDAKSLVSFKFEAAKNTGLTRITPQAMMTRATPGRWGLSLPTRL